MSRSGSRITKQQAVALPEGMPLRGCEGFRAAGGPKNRLQIECLPHSGRAFREARSRMHGGTKKQTGLGPPDPAEYQFTERGRGLGLLHRGPPTAAKLAGPTGPAASGGEGGGEGTGGGKFTGGRWESRAFADPPRIRAALLALRQPHEGLGRGLAPPTRYFRTRKRAPPDKGGRLRATSHSDNEVGQSPPILAGAHGRRAGLLEGRQPRSGRLSNKGDGSRPRCTAIPGCSCRGRWAASQTAREAVDVAGRPHPHTPFQIAALKPGHRPRSEKPRWFPTALAVGSRDPDDFG